MKHEVIKTEFVEALVSDIFANWSREGAGALWDYYGELWLDVELDIVAIRGDFSELEADDIINDYGYLTEYDSVDDIIRALQRRTTVIELNNGSYIVACF